MNRRTAFDDDDDPVPIESHDAAIHVELTRIDNGVAHMKLRLMTKSGLGIVRDQVELRPGEAVVLNGGSIRLEVIDE